MKINLESVKSYYKTVREKLGQPGKERNRIIILILSYIFFLDYLMFSYLTDKNIFNIFPSIPSIEDRREINIFIPILNGRNIVTEKRFTPEFNSRERFAGFLIGQILKGSHYENTTQAVPIDLFIRKIWIRGDAGKEECIIDVTPTYPEETVKNIPGSEELFRNAVSRTLKENIPGLQTIHFLVQGIPGKKLWEM